MSEPSFDQWTPQRPPADFADIAVRAMLDMPAPARSRRRRRSWFGVITLAAFLLGTSTWAMWAQRDAQAAHAVGMDKLLTPVVVEPVAPARAAAPAPEPVEAEPVEAGPEPVIKQAPRRSASKAKAEIQDELPQIVMQPRCVCEHDGSICSCVE